MEEARKIKPLFAHSIHLQNLHKYQDLIKRRYKTTLNFKFTCPEKPSYYSLVDNKQAQNKLFKALKLLKVIKKANLSGLKIETCNVSPHKTLAIYKRISKIKSISVLDKRSSSLLLYNNFAEEWLKYLPALRDLNYELEGMSYASDQVLREAQTMTDRKHPLRTIKYCPKIQSLCIKTPNFALPFLKPIYTFQQYPSSIKRLSIAPELHTEYPNASIESLNKLQSIHWKINPSSCPNFIAHNMNSFSKLQNLQELDLQFTKDLNLDVYTAFRKVSEQGTLKKLKLNFDNTVPKFEGVLKALKDCKLTHFSLKGHTSEEKMLEPVAKFLKGRTQLECLKLSLIHGTLFRSPTFIEDICREINKNPALSRLSLQFHSGSNPKKKDTLMVLVPNLQATLSKAIKLESLSLKCNQLDPSEEFQSLMTALQGSTASLQKLKVDFGVYFPNKQAHNGIISFLQSLESIRVLKLRCLEIGAQKFLNDFVETVREFKYLRDLVLGNIRGTVSKPTFLDAVEAIVMKRGLKGFDCAISIDFMMTLRKKSKCAPRVDLKKVQKINPALESIPSVHWIFDEDMFDRNW